jgi:hypothetical protein
MKSNRNTIYIRLLEGGDTLVPCYGNILDETRCEILENNLLDLQNDATSIWEFFPGDIAKYEVQNGRVVAKKLISSSFPNRKLHQFIFHLVDNFGKTTANDKELFQEEISKLCADTILNQRYHPIVEKWLRENCASFKEGKPTWL